MIGFLGPAKNSSTEGPDLSTAIGLSKSIDDAIQQQAIDAERQSWADAMKDEEPPDEEEQERIVREAVKKAIRRHKIKLLESDDPNYKQYVYELDLSFYISKTKGGDRQQTLTDIRAIPGVTTVTAQTSRKDPYAFITDATIRFTLNTRESPVKFIRNVVAPGLRRIRGLSNIRVKGVNKS